MTMTVNLGEALERSVEQMVATGRYGSRSEVLREGVRLVEEREQQLERFKRELLEALEEAEAGHALPVEESRARVMAKLQALAAEQA